MNGITFLVRVSCMTYNHAPYIVDAMNGFTIQQTNFPFVCTIIDDASTDGEPEIISKYLQVNFELEDKSIVRKEETDDYILIFARHITNINCYFAVIFLKYNHYSIKKIKSPYVAEWKDTKYTALCEGDDYWTDSQKLQKQVDFLNLNQDYSMCFHKAEVLVESGDYSHEDNSMFGCLEEREYTGIELAQRWQVPTASILYRSYIKPPVNKNFNEGDVPLQLQCAREGRVFCFSKVMSVYRRTSCGATLRTLSFKQKVERYLAYIQCFPEFKSPYEIGLVSLLAVMFYSRNMISAIKVTICRPSARRYLFKGIYSGFGFRIRRYLKK